MDAVYTGLIEKIKQKKELKDISDSLILDLIENKFKKYNLSITNPNDKRFKLIMKEIRAELRIYSGMFQKDNRNREKMLSNNEIDSLLSSHISTAERIHYYPRLRELIDSLKIGSILDLGCGLNPIALASKNRKYYACDINEQEIELINMYFKKNKIKGKAFIFDLKRTEKINELPAADLCLIFKVLDIIETKNHKIANALLSEVKSRYFVISFPTKKLSGRPMKMKRRLWLEKILFYNKYGYKTFESENEIFYLIEKLPE